MKKTLAKFIVTFFGVGNLFKSYPGTIGSLIAFPLCYLILYLTTFTQAIFPLVSTNKAVISAVLAFILAFSFLFIIGIYFTSVYIKNETRSDPKEVIIDEIVGQMLVIILCSFSVIFVSYSNIPKHLSNKIINVIFLFIMPFVLFRLFDIFKPWPINWVDKNIKGAMGIMLDDILAALFASVLHYAITFKIIDYFL